jgi:peptide/nickel transport system substrate-binding protein
MACVDPPTGGGGDTFTWGYDQVFTGYNVNTDGGSSSGNALVANQVLRGFWQFAPDGSVRPDTDFGTYRKTSDNPLVVEYRIGAQARWSDGRPIGCDDVTLTWLANSGVTGDQGFSSVSTTGYQDMTRPRCAAGDRNFTVRYRQPFADWAAMFGPGAILPAHVVEQQAGMTRTFIDLAADPGSADLTAAIAFYNTGWQVESGHLRRELMPSSGPYTIDSWVAGQSLTLKANPAWWGTPARSRTVVQRQMTADAQVQALRSGRIDAAGPNWLDLQEQLDLVQNLKRLGNKATYSAHDTEAFEHLDFNTAGPLGDRNLREALARCIPRQQIVDELIKPINPQATIQESRFVFPFQPQYADFARSTGGRAYDRVDLAGARAAIARSGAHTPITLRLGWNKVTSSPSQRRARTIALLQASCNQAGFTIVDAGTPTFFNEQLPNRDWDLALFAWINSPLVTSTDGTYTTDGRYNLTGYSNPQVDALTTRLDREVNRDRQIRLQRQIETILWQDLVTIPLHAFADIVAAAPDARNVQDNPTQAGLTWNADTWYSQR